MARVVRAIPRGTVLSYSRVAVLAGMAGRARWVGHLLARTGLGLPWWRVVRANRTLAPEVAERQAKCLLQEGVALVAGRIPAAHVLPVGDARLLRALGQKG